MNLDRTLFRVPRSVFSVPCSVFRVPRLKSLKGLMFRV